MTTRASLEKLIGDLPDDRLKALLEYGEFLRWQEERESWQKLGRAQLSRAYGPNEPEYSIADLSRERQP
jgi:hypothetical protein